MAQSSIEWTEMTWNPTTGCDKLSAGCKFCYAEVMTKRLKAMGQKKYAEGFKTVVSHESELLLPFTWKKPKVVFVNSMSDLFHKNVTLPFIQQVFSTMNQCPQHTFQVLTKRAELLASYSDYLSWSNNIWMGVSVEDERVTDRIDYLRNSGAKIKFLSLEPLIGPLLNLNLTGIDWVIVGGESGHGARPHEAVDAIWIASQVITSLQQAISRTQNPLRPMVLTIGKITGGRAPNVIADQVQLWGTVRSLHPETSAALPEWVEQIVSSVCATYGATYRLDYRRGVPSVQNDKTLTHLLESAAQEVWGHESIQTIQEPSLGAEDFAVYLSHAPGSMFRLGVGYPDQRNYPLHHPQFEVNESAILTGVGTMANAVWKYWQQ